MKGIPAMNKRGGKEYAQDSSRSGNSMGVPAGYSGVKSGGGMSTNVTRGNTTGVDKAFYEGRGGKEYATKVGR